MRLAYPKLTELQLNSKLTDWFEFLGKDHRSTGV